MGDRLTITDERGNDIFYGTKLFGYVGDLKNSQSLMFLWSLECVRKSYIDFDDFKLNTGNTSMCNLLRICSVL